MKKGNYYQQLLATMLRVHASHNKAEETDSRRNWHNCFDYRRANQITHFYDAVIQKIYWVTLNSNVSADINSMAILARPGGSFAGLNTLSGLDKNELDESLLRSAQDG